MMPVQEMMHVLPFLAASATNDEFALNIFYRDMEGNVEELERYVDGLLMLCQLLLLEKSIDERTTPMAVIGEWTETFNGFKENDND